MISTIDLYFQNMHLYTISAGERIVVFKLIINYCVFFCPVQENLSFTIVLLQFIFTIKLFFIKNSISMTFTGKADSFNRQVGNHN